MGGKMLKRCIGVMIILLVLLNCGDPTNPGGIGDGGGGGGVTVLDDAKDFTSFGFTLEGINGTINQDEILIRVPYTMVLSVLVASFSVTGGTVSVNGVEQESGVTENDFSQELIYTVTAENGTTHIYTVKVVKTYVSEGSDLGTATAIETLVPVSLPSSKSFNLIYANPYESIAFPSGTNNTPVTLTTRFWLAETELTNEVVIEVLKWAMEHGKIGTDTTTSAYISTTTVTYGGQELLDLDALLSGIRYTTDGRFFTRLGTNCPVCVSWYGAVMLCNWLTEMRDGTTENLVYTNIDSDWDHTETVIDPSKNGFRLPSVEEWDFAARCHGTTLESMDNRHPEYKAPWFGLGNYASGASCTTSDTTKYSSTYLNEMECSRVAVYSYYLTPTPEWKKKIDAPTMYKAVKSLGERSANYMGFYDMSGNMDEWCSTLVTLNSGEKERYLCGGNWGSTTQYLQVGYRTSIDPIAVSGGRTSVRICRTAD